MRKGTLRHIGLHPDAIGHADSERLVLRLQIDEHDAGISEFPETVRIGFVRDFSADAFRDDDFRVAAEQTDEGQRFYIDIVGRLMSWLAPNNGFHELMYDFWGDSVETKWTAHRRQPCVDPHVPNVCAIRIDVEPLVGPTPLAIGGPAGNVGVSDVVQVVGEGVAYAHHNACV
ncbi:MAG: hypothetical protein ACYS8Y_11435 [Planctomycetota bacterium]